MNKLLTVDINTTTYFETAIDCGKYIVGISDIITRGYLYWNMVSGRYKNLGCVHIVANIFVIVVRQQMMHLRILSYWLDHMVQYMDTPIRMHNE